LYLPQKKNHETHAADFWTSVFTIPPSMCMKDEILSVKVTYNN